MQMIVYKYFNDTHLTAYQYVCMCIMHIKITICAEFKHKLLLNISTLHRVKNLI